MLLNVVLNPSFDWFILFLVTVNALVMCTDHYPEADWLEDFMCVFCSCFYSAFGCEGRGDWCL